MVSEYLLLYVEERVRQKRELGKAIVPTALANEIAAELPNYRHLKKTISVLVLKTAQALNCAEVTGQFVKRRINPADALKGRSPGRPFAVSASTKRSRAIKWTSMSPGDSEKAQDAREGPWTE
jgi:hypothetical protein